MPGFIRDYKGAFQQGHRIGRWQWTVFTIKCAFLFIALLIAFNSAQYALLFSTSLYESLTANEVRISSLVGIFLSLIVSFVPSILYLAKRIFR